MKGLFISFEGTEGGGKTTQIERLQSRLLNLGLRVRLVREPGGTPIGEEIRHTLKHSAANAKMTPEAELLLMNASRAQLVREVICPSLEAGELIICDRFYDSTTVYQGYGRGLNPKAVRTIIDFAVQGTHPDLTLLLQVPLAVSEERRRSRLKGQKAIRDRFEDADRAFFQRVELGYREIVDLEPDRIKVIDATQSIEEVEGQVWKQVERLLSGRGVI